MSARIGARVGAFLISPAAAGWRTRRGLRVPAYVYVPGGIW